MKKLAVFLLCFTLFPLCFIACTDKEKHDSDGTSSLFPTDYQPDGWIGYKQYGSSADEGFDPAVALTTDGKFIFMFYSSEGGTEELRGTYRDDINEYILTPTEGSDEKFYDAHSEEIRLEKRDDNTLVYLGERNGVTKGGDIFTEDTNFHFH